MIENQDVNRPVTEVILMDFCAAGDAYLPIIFVDYGKALSRRPQRMVRSNAPNPSCR